MKKIEILNAALAESGLTAEAAIESWYENNQINDDFFEKMHGALKEKKSFAGINFIPSKKFVMPKDIEQGMFYYADGLIFPELIKGHQVSGIVGDVKYNYCLVIGLKEAELPWSSDCLYVNMPEGLGGKEATAAILKAAKAQCKQAEAAQWCSEYAYDGIEAGTCFMPGKDELGRIFANRRKLSASFALLNSRGLSADSLQENSFHWSSSDDKPSDDNYCGHAWIVKPSDDGLSYYGYERHSRPVRCVLEF